MTVWDIRCKIKPTFYLHLSPSPSSAVSTVIIRPLRDDRAFGHCCCSISPRQAKDRPMKRVVRLTIELSMAGQICSSSVGRFRLFRGNLFRTAECSTPIFSGLGHFKWETSSGRLGEGFAWAVDSSLVTVQLKLGWFAHLSQLDQVKLLMGSYSKTNKTIICHFTLAMQKKVRKGGEKCIHKVHVWVRGWLVFIRRYE